MDWSFFFVNRNWMPQWFMWVLFLLSCRYFCTFIPHRTLLGFWIEGSTSSYFLLFDGSHLFLLDVGLISCDPTLGWPLLKPVPKRKTFLDFRTGKRFHQVCVGGVTRHTQVGSTWVWLEFTFFGMSVPLFKLAYFKSLFLMISFIVLLDNKRTYLRSVSVLLLKIWFGKVYLLPFMPVIL